MNMKSPSLDTFYSEIDKLILLVQAYTEIDELSFIIKACRLKPYPLKKNYKLTLHDCWFDEYGNSFKITKNKKINIIYNDLSIKPNDCSTDLYYGLSIKKVTKISKLLYLCAGKDEDLNEDCFILTFLGIDNYLRSYMFLYGEWKQISPLLLGFKNLKNIGKNTDVKHFIELKNKENMPIPCNSSQAWLTFMPPSEEFLSILGKQFETIVPLLKIKE